MCINNIYIYICICIVSIYPRKRAKKNVMAGREAVVAAAKVADVYDNAIPFKFKLNVTLKSQHR